jgi:hypothetical protein
MAWLITGVSKVLPSPTAPKDLTSKEPRPVGSVFVIVFAGAVLAVAAVANAEPAIPAPVNFRKSRLSVALADMFSSLEGYVGFRLPREAAHRTLKQLRNKVKREILTVDFSKTYSAEMLWIADSSAGMLRFEQKWRSLL